MGTVSHIRGADGAMRKLTERDLDAQIASNRERYEQALEQSTLPPPSLIRLDTSFRAKWARLFNTLRLRGFFHTPKE